MSVPLHAGLDRSSPMSAELDQEDLRGRTVRGTLASTISQGTTLVVRAGSIVVLSRLLSPADFGLVAMSTVATGFLSLFRDFGLSNASVQRNDLTESQASTLFWCNLLAGSCLAAICAGMGPLLVRFYSDARLLPITLALSSGFVFTGAAAQHRALLQRRMRFASLATVDILSLTGAAALSVTLALLGFGYWSIVVMTIFPQAAICLGLWSTTRWIPGKPVMTAEVRSMLRYGGTLTLNGLIVYLAYNFDKLLLGRTWGAEALGLYSRAYQLMTLSTDSLNSAISQVAFPALARMQHDVERRRRYFLQGYRLFLTLAIPIAFTTALFAEDVIGVLLGQQWVSSAPILRRLTPTMVVISMVSPLAWLLLSAGHTRRSLIMAAIIAPAAIIGCLAGVSRGPQGVAAGLSTAMVCLVVPLLTIGTRGIGVSIGDLLETVLPIAICASVGALGAATVAHFMAGVAALPKLAAETSVMFGVTWSLVLVFGDRSVYTRVLDDIGVTKLRGQAK